MKGQIRFIVIALLASSLTLLIASPPARSGLASIAQAFWTRTGTVVHPTTLTDDVAVGGNDSSAPLFFDESAETLTITSTGTTPSLDIENTGSGDDIEGSGDTWSVTKAGVATFDSLVLTTPPAVGGGWTDSGTVVYPTAATDDVAIGGTDNTAPAFFDADGIALQLNGTSTDIRGSGGKWNVDTNGLLTVASATISTSGGPAGGVLNLNQTSNTAGQETATFAKTGTGTGIVLTITNGGADTSLSVAGPASGALPVIDIPSNAGTGPDIQGTADSWDVTKAGAATFSALTCTDCLDTTHMADADHGDFTYATGSATLDADVVAAAEMADADHGDVSWTSGVASVENVQCGASCIADAEVDADLTLAGATIGTSAITLVQGVNPTPTAEGVIEWETDDDHLIVGDGVAAVEFVPAEDVSGDATMADSGALTIAADSVALTTDTTGNYAAGDAEAGAALTGDTATAFFAAGTIEHERGGLEADVNAYSGLVAIAAGAAAEVDSKSELEAQIADVSDFCEADGDVYTGTHDHGGATLEIPNGTDPPATCAIGQVYVDTDGSTSGSNNCGAGTTNAHLCVCKATNDWNGIDLGA